MNTLRRRFEKPMRMLRRVRELFPLTNLGVLVALLAEAAYLWGRVPGHAKEGAQDFFARNVDKLLGMGRADYVVQLVAVVALSLVLVACASVLVGAILVNRAFKKHLRERGSDGFGPLEFEARRGFLAFMKMPAWRMFPMLELSWTWEEPAGFSIELAKVESLLQENVETHQRIRTERIVRRFVIEDGFGLARIVLRRTEPRVLRVLPWTGLLDSSPMLRSLAGGEDLPHPSGPLTGDRVDIRRYVPGDPLRLVLWKLYARTGELMVRTQERAIAPSIRIVAYLIAAEGDEPPAAAARVAIEGGLLGDGWTFSADGANHPAEDREGALALVVGSRSARGTDMGDGAGLMRFLDEATESEPARIVLFAPARTGRWIERAALAAKKYGTSMSVVVATDAVRDPEDARAGRYERFVRIPEVPKEEAESSTTTAELAEVVRTFAAYQAAVIAVERPTGRALSTGLRGQTIVEGRRSSALAQGVATPRRVA